LKKIAKKFARKVADSPKNDTQYKKTLRLRDFPRLKTPYNEKNYLFTFHSSHFSQSPGAGNQNNDLFPK